MATGTYIVNKSGFSVPIEVNQPTRRARRERQHR